MSQIPATQRAFAFAAYGEDPSLQTNVATPSSPSGSDKPAALIRVRAAALNPVDRLRQGGQLKMMRPETKFPAVLGYDVSGVVVDKGNSEKLSVGDAVAARVNNPEGTLAEFAVVEDATAAKIDPEKVSFEDAAAVGLAGQTALQAFRRAGVQTGDAVIITAGAGGVGTLAIQIAKNLIGCAFVAVTASGAEKIQLCTDLGADLVVDYKNEAPLDSDETKAKISASILEATKNQKATGKFDFALDCTGEAKKLVEIVRPGGQIRTLSGLKPTSDSLREIGPEPRRFMRLLLWIMKDRELLKKAAECEVDWKFHFLLSTSADQQELLDAMVGGKLRVITDSVHPLENCAKAWEKLVAGRSTGKVVVKVN